MTSPDIFYVEDDQDYAFILEHAIREVKGDLTLSVVEDGQNAEGGEDEPGVGQIHEGS